MLQNKQKLSYTITTCIAYWYDVCLFLDFTVNINIPLLLVDGPNIVAEASSINPRSMVGAAENIYL